MGLYVQDTSGEYVPVSDDVLFAEANRVSASYFQRGEPVHSSGEAINVVSWKMRQHKVEVFGCLFLDSQHCILGFEEICRGTVNRNMVYPRLLVQAAFSFNAAAAIIVHNHPSGSTSPSDEDIDLTKKLTDILATLDIRLLDHLIVGDATISLRDQGLM